LWNADATQALLAEDPAVAAWDYLASRVTKGYAPTSADLKGVPNGILGLFTSGRLAFYFGLRSDVPSMKNLAFGVVPVHQMPDGKYYNRDGPNGISITQQSTVKDTAWQFLAFDVSRGVELTMAAGFTAPTTRTLAKSSAWLKLLVPGETPEAYAAAAEQVHAVALPVRSTEIDTAVEDAYGKILSGKETAKSAMTAIVPQVNALLTSSGS
jgi:ABC-type glycerol-3-phosphate transport system substrate-binding protein